MKTKMTFLTAHFHFFPVPSKEEVISALSIFDWWLCCSIGRVNRFESFCRLCLILSFRFQRKCSVTVFSLFSRFQSLITVGRTVRCPSTFFTTTKNHLFQNDYMVKFLEEEDPNTSEQVCHSFPSKYIPAFPNSA